MCDFMTTVKDPIWKDIHLSEGFVSLFHCKNVQKLDRIRQLGPTALVYPGAVHTRLGHSLGVYYVSREIILTFLKKGYEGFSKEGVNSFLCAALLHDLGHFPYAHSLKDVITQDHESLGASYILQDQEILEALKKIGANPSSVCAIINKDIPIGDSEIILYRNLLSATIDPDKLDYLCRDATYCGVPYGIQDAQYIIHNLEIKDNKPLLPKTNISSIEHLLFSKYMMYKSVYWNKKVRSATAMIRKAITDALDKGFLKEEELFGIDDDQFFYLLKSKKIPLFNLVEDVRNNHLFEEKLAIEAVDFSFTREEFEKKLLSLNPQLINKIIVDVPEPISFESDLSVDGIPFCDCDPIFNKSSIKNLSKSLRMIRVFAPEEVEVKFYE